MKKILLFLIAILSILTTFAQPAGMLDETLKLKSIITNNTYYTPNGENPDLSITNSSVGFYLQANAIENILASEDIAFDGNSLTIARSFITQVDCLVQNCYYESLYFYSILTSIYNKSKTFTYYFNERDGYKYLRDADNNWSYFSTEPAPEPDSRLFQTWYLYMTEVDMGDPIFYTGPNPPQITVNPDLTYTGLEDCALKSGEFILGNGNEYYDCILRSRNYVKDESNCPPGPVDYVMWELEYGLPLGVILYEDNNGIEYFQFETSPGFISHFRNVLLSTPKNNLSDLKIFPNPVQNKLILQSDKNIFDSVTIIDINGRIIISIKNSTSNEIDVSVLKSGMYFLNIQSSEGNVTNKFIKN